jgi:phosphatidylserine/phosphatidylglycerophosphate/cardiolipin synthase-like enzyme
MRRLLLALGVLAAVAGCSANEAWIDEPLAVQAHLQGSRTAPHRVALLETGRDALLYRLQAIREAERSVRIQTFILNDCSTTRLLLHELVLAARRGVEVRILADRMFSYAAPESAARTLAAHPNLRIRAFNPVLRRLLPIWVEQLSSLPDFSTLNRRMHNKVFIVDDVRAVCGGRNYSDEYYDEASRFCFRDRDVAVEGPVVAEMAASFDRYWDDRRSVSLHAFQDVSEALEGLPSDGSAWTHTIATLGITDLAQRTEAAIAAGHPALRWHVPDRIAFWADAPDNPPDTVDPGGIGRRLVGALASAKDRLVLQSPYLVLTDRAMTLFARLRRSGVTVTVSTNSLASTDNLPSYAHAMMQRREFVQELQFDLHELKPYPSARATMIADYDALCRRKVAAGEPAPFVSMHAKSLVIDDGLALIGSYNMDPRSAALNSEVVVAVWSRSLSAELAERIERDCDPGNAWLAARREHPLPARVMLDLMDAVNRAVRNATTLDLWPLRTCALFELKAGERPVPPGHPDFYARYRDVGQFPGVDSATAKIVVQLLRSLSGVLRPFM